MNPKEILENRSEGGCLKIFEKELNGEPDIATNWDTIVYLKWKHKAQLELCSLHYTSSCPLQRKCTVLFNLAQSYFWGQIYSACYRDLVAIFSFRFLLAGLE